MDKLLNGYKLFFKYRRWTAITLGGVLLVKNSLPDLVPPYVFMPMHASLECSQYPFSYQAWLLRITQHDMKLPNNSLSVVPFINTQFETCSGGLHGFGPLKPLNMVGIPKSFYCTNIMEVSDLNVAVGAKKINGMDSGAEQDLLRALVLSESAQKYAVARELYYLLDNWALIKGILPSFFVFLGYLVTFHGPKILFSKGSPVNFITIIRFTIASIALVWLSCTLAKNQLVYKMTYSIDAKAAKVNSEYAEGGVEYFEKHCAWNNACRILLGAKGDKIFTVTGNQKDGLMPWNWLGPSNTQRLKRVKEISDSFDS